MVVLMNAVSNATIQLQNQIKFSKLIRIHKGVGKTEFKKIK